MFVIAVLTEMSAPEICSETRILTRSGFQIITEHESYFVSKERFLKKYKDNLFIAAGTKDRLLSFDEAQELRSAFLHLEEKKTIKVKGRHLQQIFNGSHANYNVNANNSDIAFVADNIYCDMSGNNNNVQIITSTSSFDIKSSSSTVNIDANNTSFHLYMSNCFVEVTGSGVEIMLIGNNNVISGITDGITVISRGKRNEFIKKEKTTRTPRSKYIP